MESKDIFKSNNVICLLAQAVKYLSDSWYTTFTSHKKEDFKYLANIFLALIAKFKKNLYTNIQKSVRDNNSSQSTKPPDFSDVTDHLINGCTFNDVLNEFYDLIYTSDVNTLDDKTARDVKGLKQKFNKDISKYYDDIDKNCQMIRKTLISIGVGKERNQNYNTFTKKQLLEEGERALNDLKSTNRNKSSEDDFIFLRLLKGFHSGTSSTVKSFKKFSQKVNTATRAVYTTLRNIELRANEEYREYCKTINSGNSAQDLSSFSAIMLNDDQKGIIGDFMDDCKSLWGRYKDTSSRKYGFWQNVSDYSKKIKEINCRKPKLEEIIEKFGQLKTRIERYCLDADTLKYDNLKSYDRMVISRYCNLDRNMNFNSIVQVLNEKLKYINEHQSYYNPDTPRKLQNIINQLNDNIKGNNLTGENLTYQDGLLFRTFYQKHFKWSDSLDKFKRYIEQTISEAQDELRMNEKFINDSRDLSKVDEAASQDQKGTSKRPNSAMSLMKTGIAVTLSNMSLDSAVSA